MDVTIEVRDLTKRYPNILAVDHINFEVRKSEIFGFLGPNGAGKTTTINMLTGVTKPTSDTAFILGYDLIRELHFHTLRKFFRTQCENAGVKRSYWDFWMGHKGGYLDESYFRAAEEEHVKEYRKAIPCLTIETNKEELARSIKEMEEKQLMKEKALMERIVALERERKQAIKITRETHEDLKRLKEEIFKGKKEKDCENGEHCQKVIGEEELESWLVRGWEARIVLPSGKIIIEH